MGEVEVDIIYIRIYICINYKFLESKFCFYIYFIVIGNGLI